MSWIPDRNYKWYETFAINVIKCGPVPRHIAFIMDGNRRFAKSENLEKIEGHTKGFEKLADCLRWCLDVGVKEVTAFAFSIENFKRSPEEVNGLMNIATAKFEQLFQEEERLRENGVRIRILGNIALLSEELQQLIAKATLMTEKNDKLFLNIAFAYTSRDEITGAIQTICQDGDSLAEEDITEELIEQCLYTKDIKNPDLLVRTSGESRLSDFLMWQLSSTVLYFTNTFWPAITLWHLLYGIFTYQRSLLNISSYKNAIELTSSKTRNMQSGRVKSFLQNVDRKQHDHLVNLANTKHKND